MFRMAFAVMLSWGLSSAQASRSERYILRDRLTLSEISIQLYGTKRHWRKIAELNHISAPYRVRIGQKFRLPKRPTLTLEEGNVELLAMWRKRFKLEEKRVTAVAPPAAVVPAVIENLAVQQPERKETFTRIMASELPAEEVTAQIEERNCADLAVRLSKLSNPVAASDLQKGVEDLDRCEAKGSDPLAFRLQRVRLLLLKGDRAEAKRFAESLVSDSPALQYVSFIRDALSLHEGVR